MDHPASHLPAIRTDTRECLLDAAERLFGERGYEVGTREIVEAAGVNIASINYHFGSKSELYLATVRRAMARSGAEEVWSVLRRTPANRIEAAEAIGRFIRLFLGRLLDDDTRDAACKLIMRETAQPSEAIDAVVRDFIEPHQRLLVGAIAVLKPDLDPDSQRLHAVSILSQVLHYRVFRPVVERLGIVDLQSREGIDRLAAHIASFSLRALGCQPGVLQRAVDSTERCSSELATRNAEVVP